MEAEEELRETVHNADTEGLSHCILDYMRRSVAPTDIEGAKAVLREAEDCYEDRLTVRIQKSSSEEICATPSPLIMTTRQLRKQLFMVSVNPDNTNPEVITMPKKRHHNAPKGCRPAALTYGPSAPQASGE